jgi:hypothetical protein
VQVRVQVTSGEINLDAQATIATNFFVIEQLMRVDRLEISVLFEMKK